MTGLDSFQQEILTAFFERQQGFFLTGGAAWWVSISGTGPPLTSISSPMKTSWMRVSKRSLRSPEFAKLIVERLRTSSDFRRFLLTRGSESLVVDLVRDRSPQIDEEKPEIHGIRVDSTREIMANKLCTLLSRAELRDLVDVRALDRKGLSIEEHLPLAAKKDAGLTAAQLAWVLSQIEIGDDATPPGGVSATELQSFVKSLIRRLTAMAYPD